MEPHSTAVPAGPGYIAEAEQLIPLRRVGGQVRGLQRRVEADTNCTETLTQVSAGTKAPDAVGRRLPRQLFGPLHDPGGPRGGGVVGRQVAAAPSAIAALVGA